MYCIPMWHITLQLICAESVQYFRDYQMCTVLADCSLLAVKLDKPVSVSQVFSLPLLCSAAVSRALRSSPLSPALPPAPPSNQM